MATRAAREPIRRRPKRRPVEEPLPVISGRYLWAALILGVMIIIPHSPIGQFLSTEYGPKPEFTDKSEWRVGNTTEVEITLITADAGRLSCAHEQSFGEIHCEYKNDRERWPRDPSAPLDDNNKNVIQPYRTSPDNQLILVSGIWAEPTIAMRLHREPPAGMEPKQLQRFVTACRVEFVGELRGVKTRWDTSGQWQTEPSAMVAKALDCSLDELPSSVKEQYAKKK